MKHFTSAVATQSDTLEISTSLFLAAVAHVLRNAAFDKQTTAEKAGRLAVDARDNSNLLTEQDFVDAGNALARVLSVQATTPFMQNLVAAVQNDVLGVRDLRLVQYAVKMYFDVKDVVAGSFVGVEKQRMELVVTVASSDYTESEWGVSYRTFGITADGNRIMWYAKEQQKPGSVLKIKGTVTRHSDFGGIKTTQLNRVALL